MDVEPTAPGAPFRDADTCAVGRQVALIDLLDRLLAGGVVLAGDLVLCIADVDLVRINLRAVIESITDSGVGRREGA
jgi:hypothetical protein